MITHLADSLLPAASWILFASLKSLVVIALVLLVRRLCARWLTPQGRYGLWFALIACLAIPFGAQVRLPDAARAPAPATTAVAAPTSASVHEQPVITISDAPAASTAEWSPASKAALIWLLGVAGLAGVVLFNVTRFRCIISRAADVEATSEKLFRDCRQQLNIRRRVKLRETSRVTSPLVVGYWRPTLLLPRDLAAEISSEQLRLVLLHELAHVRRHDILVNWLMSCVQVAHWFNPLAWYALRAMRDDMEHACDATVLRRLAAPERIEYGNTLIRMSDLNSKRPLLVQSAGVIERHSQLKARINMIAQFKPRKAVSSVLGAALLALTGALAVTQAGNAPPQPVPTNASPQPARPVIQTKKPETKQATPTKKATPAVARKPDATPKLETAFIQVHYAFAKELVSYIESAPRLGLISEKGNIGVNERANTILVRDTASNVAIIRQLISKLDVPVQQVLVEAYFALVDSDLAKEMIASASTDSSEPSPMVLGPGKVLVAALKDGNRAHRAEIISAPRYVVANRTQASIKQSADMPPPQGAAPDTPAKHLQLGLELTPTVNSDQSIRLKVDTSLGTADPRAGTPVPTADTRHVMTTVVLKTGAAVMLDLLWRSNDAAHSANAGTERRLIAIVVPKVIPAAKASSR